MTAMVILRLFFVKAGNVTRFVEIALKIFRARRRVCQMKIIVLRFPYAPEYFLNKAFTVAKTKTSTKFFRA